MIVHTCSLGSKHNTVLLCQTGHGSINCKKKYLLKAQLIVWDKVKDHCAHRIFLGLLMFWSHRHHAPVPDCSTVHYCITILLWPQSASGLFTALIGQETRLDSWLDDWVRENLCKCLADPSKHRKLEALNPFSLISDTKWLALTRCVCVFISIQVQWSDIFQSAVIQPHMFRLCLCVL